MKQRRLMLLDPSTPKTYQAPIHPETGEEWGEKLQELTRLATLRIYGDDESVRADAAAKYDEAVQGVTFASRPRIEQCYFSLGSAVQVNQTCGQEDFLLQQQEALRCHPETWQSFTDAEREAFDVRASALPLGSLKL